MKKLSLLAVGLCLWMVQVQAQTKLLTIEDAILKGRTTLAPERLSQLALIPGTSDYAYVGKKEGKEVLIRSRAGSGKKDTLFGFEKMSNSLLKADTKAEKYNRFPFFTWKSGNVLEYNYSGKRYRYTLDKDETSLLTSDPADGAENLDRHESSNHAAFVRNNNLFVQVKGKEVAVSKDGGQGIVYGKSVHREEFGITKGTFWSPTGSHLAFYRMDESMVTEYPIYDLSKKPATHRNIRYPVAGAASHHVKLGVYQVSTGKTWYIETGEPAEQYLTNIAWTPDETGILIAVLNRAQNHMKLNLYEAATGKLIRTLFEEKDNRYVEPEHAALFVPGTKDAFIWQSERDGYDHLYLYNLQGKLIRQLTKGPWVVTAVHGFDPSGKNLFISGTRESALEQQIYRVTIGNGELKKLTSDAGTHMPLFNSAKTLWIDNWSAVNVPRVIAIRDQDGKLIEKLVQAGNPLKDYAMPTVRSITLKAEDGFDLYGRILLPPNFDSTKKYPVLQYLYGGPHLQLVTNSWLAGADLWLVYMAQQGYIVFSMDNHGSPNRGRDFEQAIHRHLGKVEMSDQLIGARYLQSLPYVDAKRMAVYGWSFGGFMTTSLMLKSPDTFKVGIAGGPVIDWSLYEIMYTERYMDTPTENPEGYKETNLLNHVDKLKGRLLQIHGGEDGTVLWQHSLEFLKASVAKGKLIDYYVYPDHEHNVSGPDRVHLMKKITQYIQDHL